MRIQNQSVLTDVWSKDTFDLFLLKTSFDDQRIVGIDGTTKSYENRLYKKSTRLKSLTLYPIQQVGIDVNVSLVV